MPFQHNSSRVDVFRARKVYQLALALSSGVGKLVLTPQTGHPSVGLVIVGEPPLISTFALGDTLEFVMVIAPPLFSTSELSSKQEWLMVMFPALFVTTEPANNLLPLIVMSPALSSSSIFPFIPVTEISASFPEICRWLSAGTLMVKPHRLPLILRSEEHTSE